MKLNELIEQVRPLAKELSQYEDIELKLDTLEAETDYKRFLNWLYEWLCNEEAREQSQKDRMDALAARKKATANRIGRVKDMMGAILIAVGEDKLVMDEYTISKRKVSPKPIIQNEDALPDEYFRVTRSVDKRAVNDAIKDGKQIDGVVMDNGGTSITVRRT